VKEGLQHFLKKLANTSFAPDAFLAFSSTTQKPWLSDLRGLSP